LSKTEFDLVGYVYECCLHLLQQQLVIYVSLKHQLAVVRM